jgi:hypothetical protein
MERKVDESWFVDIHHKHEQHIYWTQKESYDHKGYD